MPDPLFDSSRALFAKTAMGQQEIQSRALRLSPITRRLLILIDGKRGFQRQDGSRVDFINFPAVASSPPGIRGDWVAEDVQAVLKARMK